jgi:hypothetical protein
MNEDGISFDEEQAYRKVERQKKIPDKGIEGWIYNKLPGKYSYKKSLLILIVIGLFVFSFTFFILGLQNIGEKPGNSFINTVENSQNR